MDSWIDTGCGSPKCGGAVESVDRRLPGDTLTCTITRSWGGWFSLLGQGLIIGFAALAPLLAEVVGELECTVDGRTVTRFQSSLGRNADAAGHPWQVALFKGESFACSGVLLRAEWVLTTSRCVADVSLGHLAVGYGEGDLLDIETDERYAVREVFIHPEFAATPRNDIALLRLAAPVANARNSYANLPLEGETSALERYGTCAVVTGWRPEIDSRAMQAYDGEICSTGKENGEICVSAFNHSACLPGGAVTVGGLPNRPRWLVGIVSAGERACGKDGITVGFGSVTRVAQYREWIESTMASPSLPPNFINYS